MYDVIIIGGGPAGITAGIYIKTASLPILNDITNEQLRATARHFGVTPKDGWLE